MAVAIAADGGERIDEGVDVARWWSTAGVFARRWQTLSAR